MSCSVIRCEIYKKKCIPPNLNENHGVLFAAVFFFSSYFEAGEASPGEKVKTKKTLFSCRRCHAIECIQLWKSRCVFVTESGFFFLGGFFLR